MDLGLLSGAQNALRTDAFRTILLEQPSDASASARCEAALQAAGLTRLWHDPTQRSHNEVWVRSDTEEFADELAGAKEQR